MRRKIGKEKKNETKHMRKGREQMTIDEPSLKKCVEAMAKDDDFANKFAGLVYKVKEKYDKKVADDIKEKEGGYIYKRKGELNREIEKQFKGTYKEKLPRFIQILMVPDETIDPDILAMTITKIYLGGFLFLAKVVSFLAPFLFLTAAIGMILSCIASIAVNKVITAILYFACAAFSVYIICSIIAMEKALRNMTNLPIIATIFTVVVGIASAVFGFLSVALSFIAAITSFM